MISPVAVDPVNETISIKSVFSNASAKALPIPITRFTDPLESPLFLKFQK